MRRPWCLWEMESLLGPAQHEPKHSNAGRGDGMKRTLFTLASAASLLLCVAVLVLWTRSYRVAEQYSRYDGTWTRSFGSTWGRLYYISSAAPPGRGGVGWQQYPPSPLRERQPVVGEPGVRHRGAVQGVFWYITDGGTGSGTRASDGAPYHYVFFPNRLVFVPHWLAAGAFGVLPVAWFVGRVRRRRRACGGGRCTACGYDLTGNASGVCPECGTALAGMTAD